MLTTRYALTFRLDDVDLVKEVLADHTDWVLVEPMTLAVLQRACLYVLSDQTATAITLLVEATLHQTVIDYWKPAAYENWLHKWSNPE